MPTRHPQIGQGKQRVELGSVLGQTAIAHLHTPKLTFDDAERVLCLGSDLRLGALNLINELAHGRLFVEFLAQARSHEGAEYDAARSAANAANGTIRREQGLVGQAVDVHEIQPVKFGGSATDPANKVVLPRDVHRQQVTP